MEAMGALICNCALEQCDVATDSEGPRHQMVVTPAPICATEPTKRPAAGVGLSR